MEEKGQATLEVAQEEDAPPQAPPADAQGLGPHNSHMGVWGNSASSLAPVTGMKIDWFADPVKTDWNADRWFPGGSLPPRGETS